MKFLTLHDHLNPATVVFVNTEEIASVAPFGSGSSIQLIDAGAVGVHETPEQVAAALEL